MEKVLVAGANGTTGKIVIRILRDSQNFTPIAMVRKENQVEFFKSQNVETVVADLRRILSHVVKDIDKVIFAAGSGGQNVVEVDQEGAKKLIDASKKANIKKFVMLSSIGAGHPEKADQLKEYLRAKHNADEYLRESGLDYTIVRPGTLNNDRGKGQIKLETPLQSIGEISRADVAEVLVATLDDSIAHNAIFEMISGSVPITEALKEIS